MSGFDGRCSQIFWDVKAFVMSNVSASFLLYLSLYLSIPLPAFALPENAQVVGGQAEIVNPSSSVLAIHQDSQQVSINFDSFSIAQHETVNLLQPNSHAIALGRVLGQDPSEIFGSLNANGQFFLVNPNGIVFGEGATVNVGGLIASTLTLSDEDFFAGRYQFQVTDSQQPLSGQIVNNGSVTAHSEGYIALISSAVSNNGELTAQEGSVTLSAADQVTVTFDQSGMPTVAIDRATYQGLVSNSGHILADGGLIVMSAAVTNAIMETAVNNSGTIEAQGVEHQGGRVFLTSLGKGDVINEGEINVDSYIYDPAGSGAVVPGVVVAGTVELSGDRVGQLGSISANSALSGGHVDGGSVVIRGESSVAFGSSSLTTANGSRTGGEVIAIAKGQMVFREGAIIEVTGKDQGGFVEVSGYESVNIHGSVNTSASNGKSGTFLIDPFDVTITRATANNGPVGGVFTPTGTASTIDVATLEANLALGNVTVETTNAAGTESGNLTVATAIDLDGTNGNTLTLQADGNLLVNGVIADQNTVTADATTLQLIAGGNLQISDGVQVNAGGGTLLLNVGGNATLTGLVTSNSTASAFTLNAATLTDGGESNVDIDANNGGVSLNVGSGSVDGFEVAVADLSVNISGGGALTLSEQDDIRIGALGGVNDLSLTTPGTVTIPDAGLSVTNSIRVHAGDLLDSDRRVVLATQDAVLQLTAAVDNSEFVTQVTRLDASITGQAGGLADLSIVESDGLQVLDLNADGNGLLVSNGNLSLQVQQGNLSINDTVTATDSLADGVRAGLIDIQIGQGDLRVGDQSPTTVESINTVDNVIDGGLGVSPTQQVSIRLSHNDITDQSHSFTLGDGAGSDVRIIAQGGDILIDSYNDASLTLGNTRTITVNNDVEIAAYDTLTDATNGSVVTGSVNNVGSVVAHTGRAITLRDDLSLSVTTPDIVVDVSNDVSETVKEEGALVPTSNAPPVGKVDDARQLFSSIFIACSDVKSEGGAPGADDQCQFERSLQLFLGGLLIGGDLPSFPKANALLKKPKK